MDQMAPEAGQTDRYEGKGASGAVTFGGQPINPSFDLCNHSPTGFSWGYGGSGPAQLALALAMHRTKNSQRAKRIYPFLKAVLISQLPFNQDWSLTADQLDDGIKKAEALLLAEYEQ